MENCGYHFFPCPSYYFFSSCVIIVSVISLDSPIQYVPKIGPVMAGKLAKLNINTVEDLLNHLPVRYDDFTNVVKIASIQVGEFVTVTGELTEIKNLYTHGGFVLQKGTVKDETGTIDLMWFNQPFLIKGFNKGETYTFQGKADLNGKKLVIKSPKTGEGFWAVYPETAGVTSKWLRARIDYLLKNLHIVDYLPCDLMELGEAWHKIHFPKNLNEAEEARKRIIFNEVLISQLISKKRKEQWQEAKLAHKFKIVENHDPLDNFVKNLPFTLTKSQKDVINDIYQDLAKDKPMNRLLQGDVGSGKTVVAALAMLATQLNGFKSVLMAPTEILAEQHYQTLKKMGLKVGIATGSKKIIDFDMLVGTHALLNLKLDNLGLVVIDEQHRFGVSQRAKLLAMSEGHTPHTLTMTATPIPRTIALTMFGDLDMSYLKELPLGRIPIKTWVVPNIKREASYEWIKKQNTQTFIICPFIEPSETLQTIKSAKIEFEKIKNIFKDLRVGLLHGRLKSKEKNEVLNKFKNREFDILVATPVVEVGVDIPGATIMVIEDADRFGLAQLHQMRGRVGRNDQQSYCLLFASENSGRLKALEKTNSGLELAELDLKIRGPGQIFGTAQHGDFNFKTTQFDPKIIVEAGDYASKIYPDLANFPLLKNRLDKIIISGVLPN